MSRSPPGSWNRTFRGFQRRPQTGRAGPVRPGYHADPRTLDIGQKITQLREFFAARGQACVLRVASNFPLTLAGQAKVTCAEVVSGLLKHQCRWVVRSAGKGSKGERWYAWAWLATASPGHHLLVRRHLKTGDLVLVMAALAICAITAALLRDTTDTQEPPPVRPDQPPPPDPG